MAKMTVKTVYFIQGKEPKVRWSRDANRAVAQMVAHMQINHYGSHVAEVFDDTTGELHAQCRRKVSGELNIWYYRDPAKYETRFAMAHLLSV